MMKNSRKSLAMALLLSISVTSTASAQGWFFGQQEPGAYQAMHPDRDVLNGGALTPEAQMRAAGTFGVAPVDPNAYAAPVPVPLRMGRHRR
jgi:hypothetical protein